jgi:hypothetical protein
MSRGIKAGMDWFQHDTDASNDEKLDSLTSLYGAEGYSTYFILLERIYRTANFELDISDDETREVLARKCFTTREKFEKILATAIRVGCFDKTEYEERGVISSPGIRRRSAAIVERREEMRNRFQKHSKTPVKTILAESIHQKCAETPLVEESRVEESRVEESREDHTKIQNREEKIDNILDSWNAFAKQRGLAEVIKLSSKRISGIRSRLNEKEFQWEPILQEIACSAFLLGSTGWKVDFDFVVCSSNNYLKILEGKYRNGKSSNTVKKSDQVTRATFEKSAEQIQRDVRNNTESIRLLRTQRSECIRSD